MNIPIYQYTPIKYKMDHITKGHEYYKKTINTFHKRRCEIKRKRKVAKDMEESESEQIIEYYGGLSACTTD